MTKDNFESEALQASVPVLIDFWADWCMPCKMVDPILDELEQEYAGQLKIGRVNVDDQGELAAQQEVISIPTLILYVDGQEMERHVGAVPKESLLELLRPYLPSSN